jgi:hypothetical protein
VAIRLLKLGLALAILVVIWLLLLPRLAAAPAMAAKLQWLDDKGVDPSVMYYTELEMMGPIFERLARQQRPASPPSVK